MSMNPQKPKKYAERRQIRQNPIIMSGLSVCQTEYDDAETPKNVRETSMYFHCPYIIYRNVLIYMRMSAEQLEKVEKKYPNKCIKSEREICALRSLDQE